MGSCMKNWFEVNWHCNVCEYVDALKVAGIGYTCHSVDAFDSPA